MGKLAYQFKEYIVIEDDYRKGHHIIINTKGEYKHHGHIKKLSTCKMLIGLIHKEIVPNSPYLRGTVSRISLDEKYILKIKHKIDKEKQKPKFIRVNKGVIRK